MKRFSPRPCCQVVLVGGVFARGWGAKQNSGLATAVPIRLSDRLIVGNIVEKIAPSYPESSEKSILPGPW